MQCEFPWKLKSQIHKDLCNYFVPKPLHCIGEHALPWYTSKCLSNGHHMLGWLAEAHICGHRCPWHLYSKLVLSPDSSMRHHGRCMQILCSVSRFSWRGVGVIFKRNTAWVETSSMHCSLCWTEVQPHCHQWLPVCQLAYAGLLLQATACLWTTDAT